MRLQFAPCCIPTSQGRGRTRDTSFHGTSTHGFAAVEEPNVAVCLLPGTEVAFDKEVRLGGFWWSKGTGQTTAVFRQLDRGTSSGFRDALEWPTGGSSYYNTKKRSACHGTAATRPAVSEPQNRERDACRSVFLSAASEKEVHVPAMLVAHSLPTAKDVDARVCKMDRPRAKK